MTSADVRILWEQVAEHLAEAAKAFAKLRDVPARQSTSNEFLWMAEGAYYLETSSDIGPDRMCLPRREWGVYRLFDKDDRIFYVGMSGTPRARLQAHAREFGDALVRSDWEPCADRVAALKLEAQRLKEHRPVCNIRGVDWLGEGV